MYSREHKRERKTNKMERNYFRNSLHNAFFKHCSVVARQDGNSSAMMVAVVVVAAMVVIALLREPWNFEKVIFGNIWDKVRATA